MIIAATVRNKKAFLHRKALTLHTHLDKQSKLIAAEAPACVLAAWIPALPAVPNVNFRGISLTDCC